MRWVSDNDNTPKRMGPWLPTKAMAVSKGAKHFFSGIPCVNGHLAPRHASNSTCLECTRIRVAVWMKDNPVEARKMKDASLAKAAADYAANPEKYALRTQRSRRENLASYRARERAYRLLHKEEQAARVRNRRARIKGGGGKHTAEEVADILKKQLYRCAECGVSVRKKSDRHVDHIMPIALGGHNCASNLQILCIYCNQSKGAMHPIDWARKNGRLV